MCIVSACCTAYVPGKEIDACYDSAVHVCTVLDVCSAGLASSNLTATSLLMLAKPAGSTWFHACTRDESVDCSVERAQPILRTFELYSIVQFIRYNRSCMQRIAGFGIIQLPLLPVVAVHRSSDSPVLAVQETSILLRWQSSSQRRISRWDNPVVDRTCC